MRSKVSIFSFVLVISALAFGVFGSPQQKPNELITVMNPAVANRMAERLPLAPRLDMLDGKTVYMVDINWGGPEAAQSIFEEMQAWFAKNMPTVKTVVK